MLNREVGFALNNGHRQPRPAGPKSARLGLMHRSKLFVVDVAYTSRLPRLLDLRMRAMPCSTAGDTGADARLAH